MKFPEDKTTWLFINSFAGWLSAIGSISASVVALYLARRNHVKLKVDASLGALVGITDKPLDNILIISAVNPGIRPATITGIGLRGGLFLKKKFMVIGGGIHPGLPFPQEKLPYTLEEGKSFSWFFVTGTKDSKDQIQTFAKAMIESGYKSRANLVGINIFVNTSIGKSFSSKLNYDLKTRLNTELKALAKKGHSPVNGD